MTNQSNPTPYETRDMQKFADGVTANLEDDFVAPRITGDIDDEAYDREIQDASIAFLEAYLNITREEVAIMFKAIGRR